MTAVCSSVFFFFFFNDTATTEIYTLSLHDALPICPGFRSRIPPRGPSPARPCRENPLPGRRRTRRSEEHTSELQSRLHLVCRLLLEKKKKTLPPPPPVPENDAILDRSLNAIPTTLG